MLVIRVIITFKKNKKKVLREFSSRNHIGIIWLRFFPLLN